MSHRAQVTGCTAVLDFANTVLTGFKADKPAMTRMLATSTLYILPRLCPDGSELYLTTPYTCRSTPILWPGTQHLSPTTACSFYSRSFKVADRQLPAGLRNASARRDAQGHPRLPPGGRRRRRPHHDDAHRRPCKKHPALLINQPRYSLHLGFRFLFALSTREASEATLEMSPAWLFERSERAEQQLLTL